VTAKTKKKKNNRTKVVDAPSVQNPPSVTLIDQSNFVSRVEDETT
jgi:hypothetical protein